MTLSLTFDFEDAHLLYHTGMSSSEFRDEEQSGRFDYGAKNGETGLPELEIASPTYDEGSLLWCTTIGDALLLSKIHRAAGHQAVLFVDNYAENPFEAYVVLTSWNYRENEQELGPDPVIAEILSHGHEGDSAEELHRNITTRLSQQKNTSVLGEPSVDDHGDHFHVTVLVKMPGDQLAPVLTALAQELECPLGYNIVSHAADEV